MTAAPKCSTIPPGPTRALLNYLENASSRCSSKSVPYTGSASRGWFPGGPAGSGGPGLAGAAQRCGGPPGLGGRSGGGDGSGASGAASSPCPRPGGQPGLAEGTGRPGCQEGWRSCGWSSGVAPGGGWWSRRGGGGDDGGVWVPSSDAATCRVWGPGVTPRSVSRASSRLRVRRTASGRPAAACSRMIFWYRYSL